MFTVGSESVALLCIGPSLKKSGRDLWTLASPPDGRSSRVVFILGLELGKGNGKSNGNPVKTMFIIFTNLPGTIVYCSKHEMYARYLCVQGEEVWAQFH